MKIYLLARWAVKVAFQNIFNKREKKWEYECKSYIKEQLLFELLWITLSLTLRFKIVGNWWNVFEWGTPAEPKFLVNPS